MSRPGVILLLLLTLSAGGFASEPTIGAYRDTVGPAMTFQPAEIPTKRPSSGRLVVVNWNVHVGNGDVLGLIEEISRGRERPEFVFLIEEAVRQDENIPAAGEWGVPGRIARSPDGMDIAAVARQLGWWMYYAPSMRNGDGLGMSAEDRGNAILSSLPLESVESVELPFVTQRRVALMATVTDLHRRPQLRVAVTHFDTRAPLRRGWIFGGPSARNLQAKALFSTLGKSEDRDLPLIVGGDLNSWLSSKAVIDTMSQIAPRADCGAQPTHELGLTLDHIFADVPSAWSGVCRRSDRLFGSDHYPLVLSLNVPW